MGKPVKEAKKAANEAKKAAHEAKKAAKGDEEGDPGGEEGGSGDGEGDPGGEEGGNDEEGEPGGEPGGGESGGDSGPRGGDSAGPDRSTNASGSTGDGGPSSLVRDAGCSEECDRPGDLTEGGDGDAILGEGGVVAAGEFEDEGVAISASAAADASPFVLALFALLALGLLVGLAGGLRALHGRIRGG